MGGWRTLGAPQVQTGPGDRLKRSCTAPDEILAPSDNVEDWAAWRLHPPLGQRELCLPGARHTVPPAPTAREQTSARFTAWSLSQGPQGLPSLRRQEEPSLAAPSAWDVASSTSQALRSSEDLAHFPGLLIVSLTDLGQVV